MPTGLQFGRLAALAGCLAVALAQAPVAWVTLPQLPAATRGTAYSTVLSATGGSAAYSFTLMAGALPPGVQLTSLGEIRGTPTQSGGYNFTIRVISGAQTADRSFLLTVNNPALALATDTLPAAGGCGSYTFTVTATGGTPPYTFSATGLPAGLSFQPSTGVLSGTAAAGSYPVSITVRDSAGGTATRSYTLSVASGSTLQITTAALPAGTVGTAYTATLIASSGAAPYTFTVLDTPVPGLTVSSVGQITGAPTQAGSFATLYRVTDGGGCSATRRLTTDVAAAVAPGQVLMITTGGLPTARVDKSYTQTLTATGGTPPYVWSVAGGELPAGVDLLPEGAISGTPSQKGTYTFLLRVTDSAQRTAIRQLGIVVNAGISIDAAPLPSGRVGAAYSFAFTASGGLFPLTWTVTAGALPLGVQLNLFSGALTGTPFVAGDFPFDVTVRDADGVTATRSVTLSVGEVLSITTDRLPNGKILQPYTASITASGGVPPLQFDATGLPPGLTIDGSGGISGTPTTPGAFVVAVKVTDSTNGVVTRSVVINIETVFRILTETLASGQAGSPYSDTLTAADGKQPYRWSVPPRSLPLGISLNDLTGQLQGTPLEPGDYTVAFHVTDAANAAADKTLTISIRNGFRITTDSLPPANVNVFYSVTLQTAGARTPLSWSLASGALPPGISLDTAAGVLSGRTNSTGEYTFTVKAVDATLTETTKDFKLTVRDVLRLSPTTLASGDAGAAYRQNIDALDAQGSLTWTLLSGLVPDGLRLEFSASSAAITGVPVKAGSYTFTLQVRDTAGQSVTQTFTIQVLAALTILTDSLRGGFVAASYSAALTAEGGEPPYNWTLASGALPSGVDLDGGRGALNGVPTQAGTFGFTLEVRDTKGRRATKAFSIRVVRDLTPTVEALSAATVGIRYTQQLRALVTEVAWAITDGRLPDGLTLDGSTGEIRGVPLREGTFNFIAEAREAGGATGNRPYTIIVSRLDLPRFTIDPATALPARQIPVLITLSAPAPTPLTGSLSLRFQPESAAGDPAVRLSTGASARFSVAQGSTRAVFEGGALLLQSGTTAGTITLTASLASNGVPVTPEPAPVRSIRIPKSAPVLTSVSARRAGATIIVDLTGYATGRDVKSAEFQFAGGPKLTVSIEAVLAQWYQQRSSQDYGSLFSVSIPFLAMESQTVTVTLTNAAGTSEPKQAAISIR